MPRTPMARSLRLLAYLLSYPDAAFRRNLPELAEALAADREITPRRRAELLDLVAALASSDALDVETSYVELFDRGRSTSLHLFEHVHGDSRDRGPALIDLGQTYAKAGLYLVPHELPDYLPALLEFVSTQPRREARAFLSEMAHILNALYNALVERRSAYASVLGALLELAGERAARIASPPPEEPLDATWSEPPAFAGCSAEGQARPSQPQPIHFIRRRADSQGAAL